MDDITNQHSDGSPSARTAAQKRARDAIDLAEDARPENKKVASTALSDDAWELSREFICPINLGLPIEPVTAEDGKVYERADIERWFETREGDPTSPMTNEVIGTELIPAPQIRKAIEAHVESGAIKGKIAEAWKRKLADETLVKEMRADDGEAECLLGDWYGLGENGRAKDAAQARAWFERSAAAHYPRGMASFGACLLFGYGGPQNISLGLVNVTRAEELGSDVAECIRARAFLRGRYSLPKYLGRALFWMKKIVDGECKFNTLDEDGIAIAARWLRELDRERRLRELNQEE
jgi:hypothetical protein